ncbi:MAG: AlpA family transcriptional regulator [Pseudomonadota bacterium]
MQAISSKDDRLLNRKEVEEVFGISKRFLELAALRGDGPPIVRIGRSVRYWPADVRAWIDSRREDPGVRPDAGVLRR